MELIKLIKEQSNANQEMDRIASHWSEVSLKRPMSDQQLKDAIGNDLEQLEYEPDQVANMIQTIMHMIRSKS